MAYWKKKDSNIEVWQWTHWDGCYCNAQLQQRGQIDEETHSDIQKNRDEPNTALPRHTQLSQNMRHVNEPKCFTFLEIIILEQ